MRILVEKLKETFGGKPAGTVDVSEHPNFWMYR